MTENFPNDPIAFFKRWLIEASESEINDPDAMALATSTPDGKPSVRMILLKQIDERGFKFHSNCESHKGEHLEHNPYAALCFHWKSLRRQVRAEGSVEMVSQEEADAYFSSRPYARKIGAWASQQSRPLERRTILEDKLESLRKKYPDETQIPRPPYWVGYRLIPEKIEFWWDNPDRLHDRALYEKNSNGSWDVTRLYP